MFEPNWIVFRGVQGTSGRECAFHQNANHAVYKCHETSVSGKFHDETAASFLFNIKKEFCDLCFDDNIYWQNSAKLFGREDAFVLISSHDKCEFCKHAWFLTVQSYCKEVAAIRIKVCYLDIGEKILHFEFLCRVAMSVARIS